MTFCSQQNLGCSKLSKNPKKIDTWRNSNSLLSQSYRVHFSHRDVNQTFSLFRRLLLFVVLLSVCRNHGSFKCPESTIDIDPSRCSNSILSVTTELTFPTNFSLGSSKIEEALTSGEPRCCCLDENLDKLTSLKVLLLLFCRVRYSNSIIPITRGFILLELVTKNLLLVMSCSVEGT